MGEMKPFAEELRVRGRQIAANLRREIIKNMRGRPDMADALRALDECEEKLERSYGRTSEARNEP